MRHIKEVYADYRDEVVVIGVDTDPTESPERVREFVEQNGFAWHMVAERTDVAVQYQVLSQSTKFGIGPDGVIVLKAGYGTQSLEEWQSWFKQLASAP